MYAVLFAAALCGSDPKTEVAVALALSSPPAAACQNPLCCCEPPCTCPQCLCGTYTKPVANPAGTGWQRDLYSKRYYEAVAAGKPLVVFVGATERPVEGCLTVRWDTFELRDKMLYSSVAVSAVVGGELDYVKSFDASTDDATLLAAAKAYRRPIAAPPPARQVMQTFGLNPFAVNGGCATGNCRSR